MKLLFSVLFVCMTVAACKKPDQPPVPSPVEKTRKELLMNGKWMLAHAFETGIDQKTHDTVTHTTEFHPCSLDDTIWFSPAKMVWHIGKVKCAEPYIVDSTSSWSFLNDDREIKTYDGFRGDEHYFIEKLTADSLVWHFGYIGYTYYQTTVTYVNRK